jgi:acetoacetyl-CoA synthetase
VVLRRGGCIAFREAAIGEIGGWHGRGAGLKSGFSRMSTVKEGDLLWRPGAERVEQANLTHYLNWLAERGRRFDSYTELWQWSIDDLEGFWGSLWEYFDILASRPYERVLGKRTMPGAEWFPGALLNYAEHALRHEREGDAAALLYLSEREGLNALSWSDLGAQVRRLAMRLRALGLKRGDRVVAYLPNSPHAVIAMLATSSIGAVWASCGPDFGPRGAIDRFAQLQPKFAFCVDGYYYGGKPFDRRPELAAIVRELPTLEHVIYLRLLDPAATRLTANTLFWEEALAGPEVARESFHFEQVPFAHPLWILFSSGTTGLPKPIIHCHGGMIIEQYKGLIFHADMHPGERMFFFTTTGWMMWNFLVSALMADVVPVLYDGNPAYPQADVLWKMVESTGTALFGASPTYVSILEKAGIVPKERFDLSNLKSVMLAGSPVTAECMAWFYRCVKQDFWVYAGSGGTDVCTGIVGGVVTQPLYAGEIQAPCLGVAAYAFDEAGRAVVDEVGELVITRPMPSMPVGFWNDPDGRRYLESYFDLYPGIWRHGDFFKVNARGGCFVLGRSDATLNRHGVRIGTAEVYRALIEVPEIEDALIVNLDLPGGKFFMPLFVKLRDGNELDARLVERVSAHMRKAYSARHIPDKIYQVPAIPYTLTGKKMEVPVRRILMGVPVDKAANRAAMSNVDSLDFFIAYAREQRDYVPS